MLGKKKVNVLATCILIATVALFPVVVLSCFSKPVEQPQLSFDYEGYYESISQNTKFVWEGFNVLKDKLPEKYGCLKEKLEQYNPEMAIVDEDKPNGEAVYWKGVYNIQYAAELLDLVKEKGFTDEEITNDFNLYYEGDE